MREIKFRAFQSHTSLHRKPGMYLVDDLVWYEKDADGHTGEAFLTRTLGSARSSEYLEDIHLMQYTGLKDKNGVEIYEGDIIDVVTERVSSSHSTWYQRTNAHHGDVTLKMYVKWDLERAKWTLGLCDSKERDDKEAPVGSERQTQQVHVPFDMSDRDCCTRGRVIGNIYENPELLKSAA